MRHRVLFVSIFDITVLYHEVAQALVKAGHEVYWETTSRIWTDWLIQHGVDPSAITELVYDAGDYLNEEAKENLEDEIARVESNTSLTVHQILQMDQFVARRPYALAREYAFLYFRDIRDLLVRQQISLVFAEATNTNDLMTAMLCESMQIPFVTASDMRLPRGRLIFTRGYQESRLVGQNSDSSDQMRGHQFIESFSRTQTAPKYFELNKQDRPLGARKLVRSASNRMSRIRYSQNNLTHHDLRGRVALALRRTVNSIVLKRFISYSNLTGIRGRLAYYGLHVQPEASIDVQGSYFSDQVKLIKDIRRALPVDFILVVKEHPNFLGHRSMSIIRRIRKIPGVQMIHHDVSSFDIFKRAELVFSVSGTIAYEAGLLGIPSIIFTPMFFCGLSAVACCDDVSKLKQVVLERLGGYKRDLERDCEFIDKLLTSSFEARWGSPAIVPSIMDEHNLSRITAAFLDIASQVAPSKPAEARHE